MVIIPVGSILVLSILYKKKMKEKALLYFGFFTNGLKPEYYYWDSVIILKKTIMLIFNSIFLQESLICSFVIIIFNEILQLWQPYVSKRLYRVEYLSNISLLTLIYSGIYFSVQEKSRVFSIFDQIIILVVIILQLSFIIYWMR